MELTLKHQDELPAAAQRIIPHVKNRGVVALYGEMGAGKTTLVSALIKQMGCEDEVTSPTFALINEYVTQDGSTVFHFDFYRIKSASEAFDMGYEEYFYSENLCLVEWPEKIEELLPEDTVKIRIEVMADESRRIVIE